MQHHSAEITKSAAEYLWFRPLQREAPDRAALAGVSLWPSGEAGEAPIVATMSYDADGQRFAATLDTLAWPFRRGVTARIAYESEGHTIVRSFAFDCLPDPWRPLVEARDLVALMPQLAVTLAEHEGDLREVVEQAEDEIRQLCRLRGFPPGACMDKPRLDELLRLRATALAFTRLTPQANESKLGASREWRLRAERAFAALLIDAPIDLRFAERSRFSSFLNGVRMCP